MDRSGAPFVGRAADLQAVQAFLDSSARGRGGLILLAGEAGVGKTRVAEEIAARARGRGATVAWGDCVEGDRSSPFPAWVQALDTIAGGLDEPSLCGLLGEGGSLLATLLPALNGAGDPQHLPLLESRETRFRLFDEVARLLDIAARRAPLLVVVDDLHHADPASLSLLAFVARQVRHMPAAVIAIHRPASPPAEHPFTRCLVELARIPSVERIELRGLSAREVADLLAQGVGVEPTTTIVQAIHAQTGGNPSLVAELVRELLADRRWSPAADEESWQVALLAGLRRIAHGRVVALSGACRHVLRVAAVAGTIFSDSVVEAVVGRLARTHTTTVQSSTNGSGAAGALAEAETAGIIVAQPEERCHSFVNGQVRDVLYDEVPAEVRGDLHWLTGSALEMIGSGSEVETEIAYHYLTSISTTDSDEMRITRAVEYAGRAARNASLTSAHQEAARLYRLALGALDHRRNVDAGRRAALRSALAEAMTRAEARSEPDVAAPAVANDDRDDDGDAPGADSAGVNRLQRQGDYWVIQFDGRSIRLKHGRGLDYLAQLLRHPDREFLALDLVVAVPSQRAAARNGSAIGVPRAKFDATAKAAYRTRIGELREALAEAERHNDLGTAQRRRAELAFLVEELERSVGLGGRERNVGTDLERARSAVGKRIKMDIRRIDVLDAQLGGHLAASVRTGYFCSYRPPSSMAGWEVC